MDLTDPNFADAIHSARQAGGSSALNASGTSAMSDAMTHRSMHVGQADKPPKPYSALTRHSQSRVESFSAREISDWKYKTDKLQRDDHYYLKPVQQTGSSSVKYDIISNERRHFWY